MESDAAGSASAANLSPDERQALNSTILEYYKKFGRKRDLEQYFSLNTAQGDIKDVSSLFWRRMKSQDSSDSGEKSRDTSLEVCKIQIQCSAVDTDPASSQEDNPKSKSDSESPPIITEESKPLDTSRHSDEESDDKYVKSDDNNSQKSIDTILDTSINKAYSPSSSITSQRKLEWDSLADVGYANESDKRTSASSLSTLERLALKQQYSNNDTHLSVMGPPTAHSTPVDEAEMKSKGRKGSKVTKIYRKDVDCVEVNVPQGSDAHLHQQSINVNLTKHISFSVDKGGEVSVDNVKRDYSVSPEKKSVETNVTPHVTEDKEIQTSFIKTKDKSSSSGEIPKPIQLYGQGVPVLINLNNLKKRHRRKKVNATTRKKLRIRKKLDADKENVPVLEKSGEQDSEAESFEYMPGHIYNQNHMNKEPCRSSQTAGNKSSLESSGAATTDSSKGSKHSFTKDLEKSIKMLRSALNKRYDNTELKQKLIKEVVQRLLKSNYRDDESTTEFLSGLSFSSKMLGLTESNNTTTSTSDANNTAEKAKLARPKKSILRVDKLNTNAIASTSQSAPNLPTATCSENPHTGSIRTGLTTSNSSSDASSKEKNSNTAFAKISSEELYQKYLNAFRREEAYKKHLREKEQFLKQKLVATNSNILTGPATQLDVKSRLKLKELMKDLTRNNYDDGSGDASKLEGGLVSDIGLRHSEGRNQRSHSVFTLSSSGNSEQSRRSNLKKSEMKDMPKAGHSKDENMHYCCCPHHFGNKMTVTDSSVQVNFRPEDDPCVRNNDNVAVGPPCPSKAKPSQPVTRIVSDDNTGEIKYLCLCNSGVAEVQSPSDNFLIYKCSRLNTKSICCNVPEIPKASILKSRNYDLEDAKPSKGSQTCIKNPDCSGKETICIHEAVRITQTDISINPRISDPSLSDIKITNNNDCVKLVREQFRQVSKTSIDSDTTGNAEQNAGNDVYNQPSTSNTYLRPGRNENSNKITAEVEIPSGVDLQAREAKPRRFYGDDGDYTIPIQGTNMTLKVSVGSNPVTNMEILDSRGLGRPVDVIDVDSDEIMYERACHNNAVVTDAVGTVENATSVTEECSKGVQSESKGIFSQFERKPRTVNTIFTKKCAFSGQGNAPNTNQPLRKPFMRSNTFAGIEERCYGTQNEILDEFYEQEQWSTNLLPTGHRFLCSCPNPIQCRCGVITKPDLSRRKADTSCDPLYPGKKEADIHDILIDPCPYPEPNECHNDYGDNDACRKLISRPVDSAKTVDTSCDPIGEVNLYPSPCPEYASYEHVCGKCAESRKQQPIIVERIEANRPKEIIDARLRTKNSCICPSPSECMCSENEGCGKNLRSASTETPTVIETPRKSSDEFCNPDVERIPEVNKQKCACGCPDSAKCGGFCLKDAPRRKFLPSSPECSRPPSPTKSSCGCPDSAKCSGYCKKDAAYKKQPPDSDEQCKPPQSLRKTPCSCRDSATCGGLCGKDTSRRKPLTDESYRPPSSFKSSCGCSDSAKCDGYCKKDAVCSKRPPDSDEQFKRSKSPRKTSCSCPSSAKCGGFCSKDASCKKPLPPASECSRPPSPTKPSCGCPDSTKCGGYCKKDAACRKQPPDLDEQCKPPQSPRKTPCSCHNSAACGGKPLPPTDESCRPPSPFKSLCGCPSSVKCEGLCKKDAACRKKEFEVKESGPNGDGDSEPGGDSPPENSDSDYLDFQKLKNYLKSQTYPILSKRKTKTRSPSLPTDPKSSFLMSTEDDKKFTFREEKSEPGSSKIQTTDSNDLIMNVIRDVTNRYSKRDLGKSRKKKCFKEILSILNYLLDTEDATNNDAIRDLKNLVGESSSSDSNICTRVEEVRCEPNVKLARSTSRGTITDNVKDNERESVTKHCENCYEKKSTCDKGVQLSTSKPRSAKRCTESSDLPTSSECPCTSSDSVTCKVLNKIRKECEKYHRKCCRRHPSPKICQCSSTTSMNCDQCKRILLYQCQAISENCEQCKRIHHCQCRPFNRCKGYRPKSVCERIKKKCVAYNLIIQTSESMINEEFNKSGRPLKNIIVKVPPRRPSTCNVPFKEMEREIGKQCNSPHSEGQSHRSRSLPNDSLSSTDDGVKGSVFTVKDYLEKNRPDFIEHCGQRQKCLKMISEASDTCSHCSDPCSPSSSCKPCRPCSPALKTVVIHAPSTATTPRSAPPCTLFCRGVQMGCDPYKSDPCKPSDPCNPYYNLCDPCNPCDSFNPCNPCVKPNQMQVTTIEPPKLISEREMKNHSKKIYKKLPEVVQKKEELKKENIKKTNLLLANIFKKNLQKKALRGSVNLSNYNTVIKI